MVFSAHYHNKCVEDLFYHIQKLDKYRLTKSEDTWKRDLQTKMEAEEKHAKIKYKEKKLRNSVKVNEKTIISYIRFFSIFSDFYFLSNF